MIDRSIKILKTPNYINIQVKKFNAIHYFS